MEQMGKLVMIVGVSILALGALLWLGGKVPGIGKLPGDIMIKRGNFTFYFPLATSILLSIILSIILALFRRR
ncbi:MAG: DUF2905 domain-containing protein [Bacteroidota bacterium]